MIFLADEFVPKPPENSIPFAILAAIVIAGLIVFLFFSIKKEKRNYRNEVAELMEGVLKKSEIISSINRYVVHSPSTLVFSLILFDFDKFMELQNAFGNDNSKKILEESVKNIRKILPSRAIIGRVGEDRFVILVKEDYDKNETLRLANKIKEAGNKGIKVYADTIINPTISVGVAFYPTHGKTYKELMRSLDLAVFSAKNNGGNQVSLYSDEFDKEDIDNLQFYYEVKEAIKEKQFVLYYQPIVNIADNTIYGLEALLRWNHPTMGILPPSSFINILEQSGDINAVGVWGIETLIKQYIELRKIFVHKDLQLSINLSPKQLLSDTLGVTFQRIARKYKIPVDHITIEIVEFAMFEKHEIVYQNINNLKEIGFKIAVDGFGIDQNTLAKLGDAPIDIIKLDRNFLDEEDSYIQNKYLELLIDFAQKTNKVVICEGIEDLESINKIKGYGVNYAQGYYLSKPLPQDMIRDYIANEEKIVDLLNPKEEVVEEAITEVIEGEVEETTDKTETVEEVKADTVDAETTEIVDEKSSKKKKKDKKSKKNKDEEIEEKPVETTVEEKIEATEAEEVNKSEEEPKDDNEEKKEVVEETVENSEETKEELIAEIEENKDQVEEKTDEEKVEEVKPSEEETKVDNIEDATLETEVKEETETKEEPLEEVKPLETEEEKLEVEEEKLEEKVLEDAPVEENKEEKTVKKPATKKTTTTTKKSTSSTTKKPAAKKTPAKKTSTTTKKPATKKATTTTTKKTTTPKKKVEKPVEAETTETKPVENE